jgi:hypothetical protein
MTTLEKAARAIMLCDPANNPTNPPTFPDDFSATEAGQYRDEAAAAISSALLDPSDEEIDAALDALAEWKIAPPRTAVRACLRAAGVKITESQG